MDTTDNISRFFELFDKYKKLNKLISKKKVYASTFKKDGWESYKFVPKANKALMATSVLKPVSAEDKYRVFNGSTRVGYGPVNAFGMSSGLSQTDAGYGVGSFGLTPFGEAAHASMVMNFIDSLQSEDDDIIGYIVEGYRRIFNKFDETMTVVLFGFQPSFRDSISASVDIECIVDAINSFEGKIISVFIGESRGMENIEVIRNWYRDIGVTEDVISRLLFVEKRNEFDESFTEISPLCVEASDDWLNCLIGAKNIMLTGCTDPYFIGDAMLQLSKRSIKYLVDVRYLHFLR